MQRRILLTNMVGGTIAAAASSEVRAAADPTEPASPVPPAGGYVRTRDGVELFYKDWGRGRPIVFVHAWGLPSPMWDYQMAALVRQGFRCITYDRRGHGRSAVPADGYDYDTLADDLAALFEALDLADAILVGHSMAAGELVRYVTRHGAGRLGGMVFIAPMTPYPTQAPDNPDGMPAQDFEFFRSQVLMHDYPAWLEGGRAAFVTPETSLSMQNWLMGLMLTTPLHVLVECNRSISDTDFRRELPKIGVRTLVVHGDKDASAPTAFGRATARLIPEAQFILYEGAPHGLFITHMDRLNADLRNFANA